MEPTDGMRRYQSVKRVLAGEIDEVVPAGCYVRNADGTSTLRLFVDGDGMTARMQPKPGDYWVIYEDGYQALAPRLAFLEGYLPIEGEAKATNPLELLAEAATRFREYEASHRAKGTPDADAKAERNAEIAGRIEAALGQ